MDPFQRYLSSISPSRSESPTLAHPHKSRFRRHPPPQLSLHSPPKLSSSVSSSNLLTPHTPNAIAANPNASTSNLRASSPSPEKDKKGKRLDILAQPPHAHSPKPAKVPQPMASIPQDEPKTPHPNPPHGQTTELLASGSSSSLAAYPARSPLRGTPRSVASFSSLLDTYARRPNAFHSDSTLGLALTPTEEPQAETSWSQPSPAHSSPSIYSPVQSALSEESPDHEHQVQRSASLRADRLGAENTVGKGPRLGDLRMPTTRVRSASVGSPILYEDGADVDMNKGPNSGVILGGRSVDTQGSSTDRTMSRPSVPQRIITTTTSSRAIPAEKDLPPRPPPKFHVRMQSEFMLGPEFALIGGVTTAGRGLPIMDSDQFPTVSAASGESSGFESATSQTNNMFLDTSVPALRPGSSSTRPGTGLSLNHPTRRPGPGARMNHPNPGMVITLPLPSHASAPAPAPESASTRSSTSQLDSPDGLKVPSQSSLAQDAGPSSATSTAPKTSKRVQALLELLSSERAYASDLALIRDIYLPLARGLPTSYPLPPSAGSLVSPSDPPMSARDVKIIFGNIEELAAFADELSDKIEAALGSIVPGGTGEDHIGELFCKLAQRLAPMYLTYITRHPVAVARYTALSTNPSPAMMQYLATTRTMTSSITHAWDIPSLIIKPLQRLMTYPPILRTIGENTPVTMGHQDRATLYLAKDKMEQVVRQVNEGRRRWEVVKGVLKSEKSPPGGAKGRIKPFKGRPSTVGMNDRADLVKLERRVMEGAAAANSMAEQVQSWANELTACAVRLLGWSRSFARVADLDVLLGGDPQGGSEAVRAFTTVAQSLEDLSRELAAVIKEELVPQLQRLAKTTREPLLLLAHMHTLASAHHNLVNAPYSKSRPAALLEASQAYLALAAQLREELPQYVDMFERAFGIVVLRLSGWQARYFQEAERRWKEFWLALNVEESEVGAGQGAAIETIRIWWSRWEMTAKQTGGMSIITPGRVYGGGANGERGPYARQQFPPRPSTPSSDGASWHYVPPYHSKPSALSLGDQQSAASASSSAKGHSRAVSTDFASPVPRDHTGRMSTITQNSWVYGGGANEERGASQGDRGVGSYGRQQQPSHPSLGRVSWYHTLLYHSAPSVFSLGDRQSAASLSSSARGYSRVISMDFVSPIPRLLAPHVQTNPAAEGPSPKGKKFQRSSNLRTVTDTLLGSTPSDSTPARNSAHSSSSRIHQSVLYAAAAIYPFNPETNATHLGLPFLTLQIGDTLEILVEAGHPSEHSNLPIPHDDAPDCMLAARNEDGVEGWALASYLMPLT